MAASTSASNSGVPNSALIRIVGSLLRSYNVVAHLPALADIDVQIAALRLVRLHRGFDTTHPHYSSQRCDTCFVTGVERGCSVFLTDPNPATLTTNLHVPAQRAGLGIVEVEIHSPITGRAGIASFWFTHWLSPWTNAWNLRTR